MICPGSETGESDRVPLPAPVVGRGTRVGESGAARNRAEQYPHRACERRRGGVVLDAESSGGFLTTHLSTLKVFCGG